MEGRGVSVWCVVFAVEEVDGKGKVGMVEGEVEG